MLGMLFLSCIHIQAMDSITLIGMINQRKCAEVKLLIKQPSVQQIINDPDNNGDTPLIHALCIYGDERDILVKDLLDAGANPVLDNNGFTPLMLACSMASLETIKQLCAKGALQTIARVHNDKTALNWACRSVTWNPYQRAEYLIRHCPELPFLTEVDFKHLVLLNNPSTIKLLLEKRKNWSDEKLHEGLNCARERGESDMIRMLEGALDLKKQLK